MYKFVVLKEKRRMAILFFPNIISKDNFPLVSECIHLVWKWLYKYMMLKFCFGNAHSKRIF